MTNCGIQENGDSATLLIEEGDETHPMFYWGRSDLPKCAVSPSSAAGAAGILLCRSIGKDAFDGPSDAILPRKAIFCYGIGHMLNDLTAACWFTYLLIFLTDIGFSSSHAAIVMLSGQVADGIATIFVGQLIDRFGCYKLWHAGGSVLAAVSFSSVFGGCWVCTIFGKDSELAKTIAYSTFAAIFNIGWAATQVSHMSLVNCLTANSTSRVSLIGCRNAWTMVANLCLFGIAYIIFMVLPAEDADDIDKQYRWIAVLAILFGSLFVLIFLVGVKEPRLQHLLQPKDCPRTSCLSWFKKTLYYQVALVYMLTRLTTNVSQALIPFYVINDLHMGDSSKAVVPAVTYICSFLVSIGLQEVNWTGNRLKNCFASGASLWVCSGVLIFLLQSDLQWCIYTISVIIGVGNALMTVASVSMEGVLVGLNLSGCAFVYGSLSFLDKLSCGIALYLIEDLQTTGSNCRAEKLGTACHKPSVRLALVLVSGGCALLGMLVTAMMNLDIYHPGDELRQPLLCPAHKPIAKNSPDYSSTDRKGICELEDGEIPEFLESASVSLSSRHRDQSETGLRKYRQNAITLWTRLSQSIVLSWSTKKAVIPGRWK